MSINTYLHSQAPTGTAQQFNTLLDDPLQHSHTERERTDVALIESYKVQQGANLLAPCATWAIQIEIHDLRTEAWPQRGATCAGRVK